VLQSSLLDAAFQKVNKDDYLEKVIDDLAARRKDPYSAAAEIVNRLTRGK